MRAVSSPIRLLAPLCAALLALSAVLIVARPGVAQSDETTVEVFASGLINPKGLAFGDDGTLYIAESGPPSDVFVPLPANYGGTGPIGTAGRISRVPPGGEREDFVTGLPNVGIYRGAEMLGAGSVAFMDSVLYEVAAAHMTVSPLLSVVNPDGTLTTVADVGAFNDANPPPGNNGDAIPWGNPFDMTGLDGALYITDGNYNRVLKATPEGELSVFAAWEFSPVTTGIAAGPDGNLYICQFSPSPYFEGSGRIDMATPAGEVTEGAVTNLTTPIDVAFADDGTMYVLQYATAFDAELYRYISFGGLIHRVLPDGTTEVVVSNLNFPTSLIVGPDGALYVSNYGNESNEGQGEVLRVVPGDTAVEAPLPADPLPDDEQSNAPDRPTIAPTPDQGGEVVATINIVEAADIMAWGYQPNDITIQTGQAVTFLNTGQVGHTATANDGAFDTSFLEHDQSSTVTLNEPGSYSYICQPHPWMMGVINVEGEPVDPGGDDEGGAAVIDVDPPTINPWLAVGFVGGIIALVFLGGFLMRRRNHDEPVATEPPAPTEAD